MEAGFQVVDAVQGEGKPVAVAAAPQDRYHPQPDEEDLHRHGGRLRPVGGADGLAGRAGGPARGGQSRGVDLPEAGSAAAARLRLRRSHSGGGFQESHQPLAGQGSRLQGHPDRGPGRSADARRPLHLLPGGGQPDGRRGRDRHRDRLRDRQEPVVGQPPATRARPAGPQADLHPLRHHPDHPTRGRPAGQPAVFRSHREDAGRDPRPATLPRREGRAARPGGGEPCGSRSHSWR